MQREETERATSLPVNLIGAEALSVGKGVVDDDVGPHTSEFYDGELREFYEDRADFLKYRSVSSGCCLPTLSFINRTKGCESNSGGLNSCPVSKSFSCQDEPYRRLEVRLYRLGREDGLREVEACTDGTYVSITYLLNARRTFTHLPDTTCIVGKSTNWLDILLSSAGHNRQATRYVRWVSNFACADGSNAQVYNYAAEYSACESSEGNNTDSEGIVGIYFNLERGESIKTSIDEITSHAAESDEERSPVARVDNAVSIIKRKLSHALIRCDPSRSPHNISEVYMAIGCPSSAELPASSSPQMLPELDKYSQMKVLSSLPPISSLGPASFLRISYINAYGREVPQTFVRFELNNDEKYVAGRALVMKALKLMCALEYEVTPICNTVGTRRLTSMRGTKGQTTGIL